MNAYYSALDAVFAPVLALPPVVGELVIGAVITFVITLLYKFMVNQTKVKELRDQQKEMQKEVKRLQKDSPEEANKKMSEMLKLNNSMMMMNMKPMLPTMLLVILVFPLVAVSFQGHVALLPFNLPYFGADFGWLMWYFVISLPLTQLFRKLMGVI